MDLVQLLGIVVDLVGLLGTVVVVAVGMKLVDTRLADRTRVVGFGEGSLGFDVFEWLGGVKSMFVLGEEECLMACVVVVDLGERNGPDKELDSGLCGFVGIVVVVVVGSLVHLEWVVFVNLWAYGQS